VITEPMEAMPLVADDDFTGAPGGFVPAGFPSTCAARCTWPTTG